MAMMTHLLSAFTKGQPFLGLEFTDTCLKIAEIQVKSGGKPVLTRMVMEKLPPDTILDGKIKNPLELHRLLQQVMKWNDFATAKVHFVVPSSTIMVRYLKLPNVADKAMKKIVEFEVKHNIHLPFEQPYFDYVNMSADQRTTLSQAKGKNKRSTQAPDRTDTPLAWKEAAPAAAGDSHTFKTADDLFRDLEEEQQEEEAPKADVLLVAAPGELVDEYASLLRECGLKPASAEIKALSLFRMLSHAEPEWMRDTVLTVDLNDTSADISIFHEGHLKITRNVLIQFPMGESSKTQQEEDLSFLSFTDPDADFKQACGDLAHELERLMNFYRYTLNNRSQEFHTTVLTGDPDRLPEISEYLADRLNQKVIQPRMDWLETSNRLEAGILAKLAVPIGLGLRGNER
ncbi:type IV pilus biogenesis protein PilM [Gorillibacterium sp. sgz5001074]|uniref:type IV pilus biogenesis protein PilM n=1 Tax=Gorillibacterium sp. sgz5001074 TaxID=3446695 RepID=UPI003F67895A